MMSGFTEYVKFSAKKNKSILCTTRENKTWGFFSFKKSFPPQTNNLPAVVLGQKEENAQTYTGSP